MFLQSENWSVLDFNFFLIREFHLESSRKQVTYLML